MATLGKMATLPVGASPYHLSRVFRTVTGHSIHQYRMQLRLRAVLAGLATGQPITDLAMSCGFASPSHLSQLFRRCFKIPPSQLQDQLLDSRPATGLEARPWIQNADSGCLRAPA